MNNDAERDAILKLMEAEGWEWNSGTEVFKYSISAPYPFVLVVNWDGRDGILHGGVEFHKNQGDTILPASDFLPTEPTEQQIDWTKPQAFPDGYVVPKGIKVVKIGMDDAWVKNGSVGKTTQSSSCPDIEWENEDYDLRGLKFDWAQESYKLAPIDPTDHPLHPEFKGASDGVSNGVNDGESDGENPTQPIDYESLFHQAQSKVDELQAKIEDLSSSSEFDRVQRNVHREIIREKIINYAKNHPSSHSAQLLGELILDGLI